MSESIANSNRPIVKMNKENVETLNNIGLLNQFCKICQRRCATYADHRSHKKKTNLKVRQICKQCAFWLHFQRQHCNLLICQADVNINIGSLIVSQVASENYHTIMSPLTIVRTIPEIQGEYLNGVDNIKSPPKDKMDDCNISLKKPVVSNLLIVQGLLTMKKFHEENYVLEQPNTALERMDDNDDALVYGWMKGWQTDKKCDFLAMVNLRRKTNKRVESNETRTRRLYLRNRII